jgi:hypothetical protein
LAVQRSGLLAAAVTLLAGPILVLALVIAHRPGSAPAAPEPTTPEVTPREPTTRVFDADAMDRDIAGQYREKFGETVQVGCPAGQPVVTGTTFTCSIVARSERIEVIVVNDNGDYTWKPESA